MLSFRNSPAFVTCFATALLLFGCNKNTVPPPGTAPASATQPTAANPPASLPAGAGPAASPVPVAPATTAADAPVASGTTVAPAAPIVPRATPATAPAPIAPSLVIPAGTRVTIRTSQTLSAEHSDPGEGFSGVLNYPIKAGGTTAFDRGTAVRGVITSAKGSGHFKGAGVLGVELTSIGGHEVQTSEYVERVKGRGKRTAGFIGGGAGLGALIGGLAGGGKGALIGGLAGAGGGTAVSAYTGHRDVVIPAESAISFTTRSSIRVH